MDEPVNLLHLQKIDCITLSVCVENCCLFGKNNRIVS